MRNFSVESTGSGYEFRQCYCLRVRENIPGVNTTKEFGSKLVLADRRPLMR